LHPGATRAQTSGLAALVGSDCSSALDIAALELLSYWRRKPARKPVEGSLLKNWNVRLEHGIGVSTPNAAAVAAATAGFVGVMDIPKRWTFTIGW
jgi:hypothetical protein